MDANGGEPDIDRTDTDREIHDNSFLIDEGFELLADFKSIDDVAMRRTIRTLVAAIAKRHATNVVAFPSGGERAV